MAWQPKTALPDTGDSKWTPKTAQPDGAPAAPPDTDASAMHKLGADEPGYEYGDILPFKKETATGKLSLAMPEMIRSPIRGMGDLLDSAQNKSTEVTPDAISAMLGLTPVARGASAVADMGASAAVRGAKAVAHPVETAGKLFKVTSDVAGAAAKPIVQPIARSIIEADNPITGEPGLKTAMASDTAKEGMRLGKKLGVKFSAGELTGNSTARSMEDAFANSGRYGGRFAAANEAKTDAIVNNFKQTLDKIYPTSVSRTEIGDRISTAYRGAIDGLVKERRAQARADFKAANEAAGGKPVVSPHNFINTLKKYIAEGESPLATPAQKAASKQAKTVLDNLKVKPQEPSVILDQYGKPVKAEPQGDAYKKITIDDLQNGLAAFGEGAYSGGGIWKGLSTASDRRFSQAAKGALQQDMNEAADDGVGDATQALKSARNNYLTNSNKISDVEKSALGKLVGSAEHDSEGRLVIVPEKVADKFSSMEPTEIKSTLKFLDKHHPDVAQAARRFTLERALRQALEGKGQRGGGATKDLAKAEFVKNLPSDDKLNALLGSSSASGDIKDIAAAMNRMIDYGAAKKGSATAQRTDILHSMAQWGKGMIYRSIVSDSLVDDLLNPEMRAQLAQDAKKINKNSP